MKTSILLTTLCLLAGATGGFGQHQHVSTPTSGTNQVADRSPNPDKSSFPTVATTLPVSRPQAMARVKLTGKRVEYDLTIDGQMVNITGKSRPAITINGGIPGPTMRFMEGDVAVIHLHNKLKTEASLHWHGLLVPNIQDGVPYVTTPPIMAGTTRTFEFPLVQSGTYWFHAHTGFQEQLGVYGSIVIQPQERVQKADHDLVILMSDWTDEKPEYILKNLKRRNEWYSIQKGNSQSLNRIIQHKAVGAYLRQSMQKMAPMDISDVYYDRFLINGKDTIRYPEIKPGQTVRLRVINAGGSTYFHVNYAGGPMTLIAADGIAVQPVAVNRRLIGLGETYDFIVTVPPGGAFEVRASAQDGTGYATALLGSGPVHYAPLIPRPDLYKLTANMSQMGGAGIGTMSMGRPDYTNENNIGMNGPMTHNRGVMSGMTHNEMDMGQAKLPKGAVVKPTQADPMPGMNHGGRRRSSARAMTDMNMAKDGKMDMVGMNHGQMNMVGKKPDGMPGMDHSKMDMGGKPKQGSMLGMNMSDKPGTMAGMKPGHDMKGMGGMKPGESMSMMDEQNTIDYSILKATEPIVFPANHPIREIPLTLSGNMFRYIWGFNGQPLSRADVIQIRRGEIVRIRMTNNTMMMHPIHLHGHFFRVLNGQGDYWPLKHSVNVSPMESVTIEFMADDGKDWVFHCHLLYHLLSGMVRVVSYGDKPDAATAEMQKKHGGEMGDNAPFVWGYVQPGYPLNYGKLNISNNKNAIVAQGELDWRTKSYEFDLDYERYFGDWFRVFAGVDGGNEPFLRRTTAKTIDPATTGDRKILRAVAGIRYMLPFLIESEAKVDARGNVRLQLSGQQLLFPRLEFIYQTQWLIDSYVRAHLELQYTVTKNLFLHTDYDTRYRTAGGGVGYNF
ncbi:MAG: multicopper oxidase domain-containing protein [Rudanella sp.]|nr:multicopper oxidase domain-containing protein [Rudanella sp.]